MENRIKTEKLFLLEAIALSKTKLLDAKENVAEALKNAADLLSGMTKESEEEMLEVIVTTKQAYKDGMKMVMNHIDLFPERKITPTPEMLDEAYQQYWAVMSIIAYFFYRDHPLWKKCIFKYMEKDLTNKKVKADLKIAKAAIDEYYQEQKELEEAILLSRLQGNQENATEQQTQQPSIQYVFNAPVGQVNGKVEEQHNHKK